MSKHDINWLDTSQNYFFHPSNFAWAMLCFWPEIGHLFSCYFQLCNVLGGVPLLSIQDLIEEVI